MALKNLGLFVHSVTSVPLPLIDLGEREDCERQLE